MKKKESILGMAFFGPALVLLTLFLFLPMVLTLVFSFTDYFALNPDMTHFVGLENYINIFKDELFVKSFFNTVKFVIIIVPCQCIGALVLHLRSTKSHIVRNTSKWHFLFRLLCRWRLYPHSGWISTVRKES